MQVSQSVNSDSHRDMQLQAHFVRQVIRQTFNAVIGFDISEGSDERECPLKAFCKDRPPVAESSPVKYRLSRSLHRSTPACVHAISTSGFPHLPSDPLQMLFGALVIFSVHFSGLKPILFQMFEQGWTQCHASPRWPWLCSALCPQ